MPRSASRLNTEDHGRGGRTRSGFSVTELLVVLTIVGVVTALTSGRFTALMTEQRVARAATAVQNNIETGFATAVRNRAPIRIQWNASRMELDVVDRAGNYYRKAQLGQSVYGLLPGEITVSKSPIEIYPNGLAGDTLSVLISATRGSTTYSKRVRVTRAGLVQIL